MVYSLEPFALDCSVVDVQTILPQLVACGLITNHDQKYFWSPCCTSVEKQQKLMITVSLNDESVKKLLEFLSQTPDCVPRRSLLKKIRNSSYAVNYIIL